MIQIVYIVYSVSLIVSQTFEYQLTHADSDISHVLEFSHPRDKLCKWILYGYDSSVQITWRSVYIDIMCP